MPRESSHPSSSHGKNLSFRPACSRSGGGNQGGGPRPKISARGPSERPPLHIAGAALAPPPNPTPPIQLVLPPLDLPPNLAARISRRVNIRVSLAATKGADSRIEIPCRNALIGRGRENVGVGDSPGYGASCRWTVCLTTPAAQEGKDSPIHPALTEMNVSAESAG